MLKKPEVQQQEMEMVTIESLVPSGHLLRKIDKAVDFSFIHERVKHLYCEDNGRPALEPVVLFKLLLLGYLYGVRSERQLMREVEVNVAYRWFLGLRLRDKVPDASTLSQNRRRRFAESTIYQEIFDQIVELAVKKGLASGAVLYTDSTHLKANANKNKYDLARVAVKPQEYLAALDAAVAADRAAHGKVPLKDKPPPAESKEIKLSRTDKDSGYMVRDGKPKASFISTTAPSMAATPSSPTPTRPRRRCTTRCRISAAWTGSGSASASASARWASMPDMPPRR